MPVKPRQACPRCRRLFSCQPEAISICQCSTVVLSEAQRKIIQQRYQGCLCAACLQSLCDDIDESQG